MTFPERDQRVNNILYKKDYENVLLVHSRKLLKVWHNYRKRGLSNVKRTE